MTWALLLGALGKAWPLLIAVAGWFGFKAYGRRKEATGAAKERAKQAAQEQKARTIADEVDNDVGAMTPEQIDAELRNKWSR